MRALAPGLFSINTDCPREACIGGASLRAMMSVAPPGVKGTTMRIGRDGKFATGSAPAAKVAINRQPTTAARRPMTRALRPCCGHLVRGFGNLGTGSTTLGLMVRRRAIAGAACVHLAAMRAVSNHGGRFRLAAILRDALAIARRRRAWTRLGLGLLR